MARKKPNLKPTAYWLAQKDELLKPKNNLVTPLGHRDPPTNKPDDKARVPRGSEHIVRRPQASDFKIDPLDNAFAAELVAQIKLVAAAGLEGYEITESWYMPPDGEAR
jgi:hypothetical protein